MLDAGERAQRLGDRLVGDADRARGGGRGRCILAVVPAADERLRRQGIVAGVDRSGQREPARDDPRLGPLEDAQLRVAVALEGAVPVEMVGLEVEQDGDAAAELVDVLELERGQLAHDPVGVVDAAQRAADVPGDGDVPPVGTEDGAEELARRRLAVRAGDADDRPLGVEPVAELDFAPNRDAPPARRLDEPPLSGNAGALDQHLDPVEQREVVLVSEQPVDANHLDAAPLERRRRRLARPREAVDERPLHRGRM